MAIGRTDPLSMWAGLGAGMSSARYFLAGYFVGLLMSSTVHENFPACGEARVSRGAKLGQRGSSFPLVLRVIICAIFLLLLYAWSYSLQPDGSAWIMSGLEETGGKTFVEKILLCRQFPSAVCGLCAGFACMMPRTTV